MSFNVILNLIQFWIPYHLYYHIYYWRAEFSILGILSFMRQGSIPPANKYTKKVKKGIRITSAVACVKTITSKRYKGSLVNCSWGGIRVKALDNNRQDRIGNGLVAGIQAKNLATKRHFSGG